MSRFSITFEGYPSRSELPLERMPAGSADNSGGTYVCVSSSKSGSAAKDDARMSFRDIGYARRSFVSLPGVAACWLRAKLSSSARKPSGTAVP